MAPGSCFPRVFASFGLLLAPIWFYGFGAAEPLQRLPRCSRIALAGLPALPYFVFAAGTPAWRWPMAAMLVAFPILLAVILEVSQPPARMMWQDTVALVIIAAVHYSKLLQMAWPLPGLAFFSKLFLADVLSYCFLVIRRLQGTGYSLVPGWSALTVGVREWVFFLPIAVLLGEGIGFIHFHAAWVRPSAILAYLLLTSVLVAIPEELFFRAILQNLLETRLGRIPALLWTSLLFGLSHFHHGASFNWRYVLLASIAGISYGRAWRADRQVLASMLTHTFVDVVWSLWFR